VIGPCPISKIPTSSWSTQRAESLSPVGLREIEAVNTVDIYVLREQRRMVRDVLIELAAFSFKICRAAILQLVFNNNDGI
jgi:hypothetical protein